MKTNSSFARCVALALMMLVLCCPRAGRACDNPVFRYALQNWPAADYELLLVQDSDLTADEKAAWELAQRTIAQSTPQLNLKLRVTTPAELAVDSDPSLSAWSGATRENRLALVAPKLPNQPRLVWSGPCTAESVELIVDSPVRQQLVQRLLDGEAIIWIILPAKNAQQTDALLATLETFLVGYSETVAAADAQAAAEAAQRPVVSPTVQSPAPPVDKSLFWPPRFSTIELASDDPREVILVNMLKRLVPAQATDEPLVFAVFGRGRVLGGMPASQVNLATLRSACDFLTGACSCEVKDRNPGDDLLISADWSSVAAESEAAGSLTLLSLDPEEVPDTETLSPEPTAAVVSTTPPAAEAAATASDATSTTQATSQSQPEAETVAEPIEPQSSWLGGVMLAAAAVAAIGFFALRKSS